MKKDNNSVVLKIPSRFIYSLPTAMIPGKECKQESRRNYCVEQFIPLNAEEIASQVYGQTESGVVIAVELQPVNQLLQNLESNGRWVAAIVPEFLLALESLNRRYKLGSDYELFLRESTNAWNFGQVQHQRLVRWEWIGDCEVAERLSTTASTNRYVIATNMADVSLDASHTEVLLHSQSDLADEEESLILAGKSVPKIDFRSAKLPARAPLRAIVKSTIVLLYSCILALTIASFFLFRNYREMDAIAASSRQEQVKLFQAAFPTSRTPVDIVSRLKSEIKKAQGDESQAKKMEILAPAAALFDQFVHALPENGDFRFDTIRIDGNRAIHCSGIAKTLADYEAIEESLRKNDFAFPNPSINQLANSTFRFQFDSIQKATQERGR